MGMITYGTMETSFLMKMNATSQLNLQYDGFYKAPSSDIYSLLQNHCCFLSNEVLVLVGSMTYMSPL